MKAALIKLRPLAWLSERCSFTFHPLFQFSSLPTREIPRRLVNENTRIPTERANEETEKQVPRNAWFALNTLEACSTGLQS